MAKTDCDNKACEGLSTFLLSVFVIVFFFCCNIAVFIDMVMFVFPFSLSESYCKKAKQFQFGILNVV